MLLVKTERMRIDLLVRRLTKVAMRCNTGVSERSKMLSQRMMTKVRFYGRFGKRSAQHAGTTVAVLARELTVV